MKTLGNLAIGILMSTIISCGPTRVYTTGSYGSLKTYTEKQHYKEMKTAETYISGDLSFGSHEQESGAFDDSKSIAAFNLHRNITDKHYNFYYGIGATYGTYKFKKGMDSLIEDGEKKKFYTINLRSGINYTHSRPKVDWRFIGVELSYNNEFGPYQDKLSFLEANNFQGIIANQKSMLNYQIYSEYVFKTISQDAFTLGFYVGDILNYKNTEMYSGSTVFSGFSLGLRVKKYAFYTLFETGEGNIKSTKFGISYRL